MDEKQQRADYNRGWRTSIYATGERGSPLDAADARHEVNEWYDGYMDAAVGREKWQGEDGRRRAYAPPLRRGELIAELHRLNPFAGYTGGYGASLSTKQLRETLARYQEVGK